MVLAVVGLYGLLAYFVKQRSEEIGIRMALGSSKTRIVRLILREGLGLLGLGLLIGLPAALAFTRLLGGFLYDCADSRSNHLSASSNTAVRSGLCRLSYSEL